MKKLFVSALMFMSFSAFSQGHCHKSVDLVVSTIAQESFQGLVAKASSEMIGYAGFHTKKYDAEVLLVDGTKVNYEVIVFEYETPGTSCEIDQVTKM